MFDYIYYKSCQYYKNRRATAKSFQMYSCLALSAMELFNLMSVLLFARIWINVQLKYAEIFIGILYITIIVVNSKRYSKISFDDLEKRYENDENYALKGVLVMLYFIFSIAFMFLAAMLVKHYKAT